MHIPTTTEGNQASVLTMLRSIDLDRPLTLSEATELATIQAYELRYAYQLETTPRLPLGVITGQPEVVVEHDFGMPSALSGVTNWNRHQRCWVITINGHQAATRQRFTTLHEYKHILDHGQRPIRVAASQRCYGLTTREFIAEYFAGCALVPGNLLSDLWRRGFRDVGRLSQQFDVSVRAIQVRLEQLGLTPARGGCGAKLAAMDLGRVA